MATLNSYHPLHRHHHHHRHRHHHHHHHHHCRRHPPVHCTIIEHNTLIFTLQYKYNDWMHTLFLRTHTAPEERVHVNTPGM